MRGCVLLCEGGARLVLRDLADEVERCVELAVWEVNTDEFIVHSKTA